MNVLNNRMNGSLIALLIFTMISSGCSVMGLGTGAMIDSAKPDSKFVDMDQVASIKPGTKTVLYVKDGYVREGKFAGFAVKSNEKKSGGTVDTVSLTPDSFLILQPLKSVKSNDEYEYIPARDLIFAEVKNKKNAKYIGLGIGLLIDIVLIASAYIKATDTLKRIPYEVATSGENR